MGRAGLRLPVYIVAFEVLARLVYRFSAFRGTGRPLELAVHPVFGAVFAASLGSTGAHRRACAVG